MAEKVLREAINIDSTAFEAWLVFWIFRALHLFSVSVPAVACFIVLPMQSFLLVQCKALSETHNLSSIIERTETILLNLRILFLLLYFSLFWRLFVLFFFSVFFFFCF